ncbi:hypothetical protein PCASD_00298 [Puccinia coronata f. sp. avenae]|uniref:Uncharacterized protein n=1 Tax=Puccinia coronata f. sp. avenae TaxID=200324 RepID=A0A2N5VNH8_9BASI|nr:hypothetical protein PCASD_00298 [Puccinia coronata f. sp. avenae]
MKPSVWGMPCAALSSRVSLQKELANPLVAPFIDFYPEDPKDTINSSSPNPKSGLTCHQH